MLTNESFLGFLQDVLGILDEVGTVELVVDDHHEPEAVVEDLEQLSPYKRLLLGLDT